MDGKNGLLQFSPNELQIRSPKIENGLLQFSPNEL